MLHGAGCSGYAPWACAVVATAALKGFHSSDGAVTLACQELMLHCCLPFILTPWCQWSAAARTSHFPSASGTCAGRPGATSACSLRQCGDALPTEALASNWPQVSACTGCTLVSSGVIYRVHGRLQRGAYQQGVGHQRMDWASGWIGHQDG